MQGKKVSKSKKLSKNLMLKSLDPMDDLKQRERAISNLSLFSVSSLDRGKNESRLLNQSLP